MNAQPILFKKVGQLLSKEILIRANQELKLKPITVTASYSDRSAGGRHDFFSEAEQVFSVFAFSLLNYHSQESQTKVFL